MYPSIIRQHGLKGEATKKQIEYAEAIAELLGVGMPVEKTKQEMSDFINVNVMRYKKTLAELKVEQM